MFARPALYAPVTDVVNSIIGSLAGTSYWGPVAGHSRSTHDLNEIRGKRKEMQLERAGTIPGDIEAVPAGENSDGYVAVKKRQDPPKDDSKPQETQSVDKGSDGGKAESDQAADDKAKK
jgi:hypothetical protein